MMFDGLRADASATAERRMVDACVIGRRTSRGAFNPGTGEHDAAAGTAAYDGKCYARTPAPSEADVPGAEVTVNVYVLEVPLGALGEEDPRGMPVEMTKRSDPQIPEHMTVIGLAPGSFSSRTVLRCEASRG